MKKLAKTVLFVALAVSAAWSDPRLPNLITDHVVFQRGMKIHIWGWASGGEKVTVSMAGQQAVATTGSDGRWSIFLPPMTAGGPYTLTVAGSKTLIVKDVLVGEVWVASGQSNMAYVLNGATGGPEEVAKANYPEIRLFTVPKKIAVDSQENTLPASWKICTPESAKEFSAVAYFFARELHRRLGVPIGIIESAWPGTRIEEWMNPEAFNVDPEIHAEIDKWNNQSSAIRDFARSPLGFKLQFKDFELTNDATKASVPVRLANYFDVAGQPTLYWSYDWANAPDSQFELRQTLQDGSLVTVQGALDNTEDSFLAGNWSPDGQPINLSAYAGLRFKVRGDGQFRVRFIEPTITDWDDYASTLKPASGDWKEVTIRFSDLHQEGWGVVREFTPQSITGIKIESTTPLGYVDRPPSGLFQGMITPLLPFPVRGAIWYQGESNALRASLYRRQLTGMINGWRKGWGEPDADFLIVQLPNHGVIPEQPSESAWAELREAQLLTAQSVPHSGLAVTIDIGEPRDVHPPRKLEVGQRLAYWALGTTYGKRLTYSGPLFQSAEAKGNDIVLHFSNADGLSTSDGKAPQGFSIAGPDRRFYWADASIEGNTVVVSSPSVTNPVMVRYAWGDSPRCNLVNGSGLPGSPFRTDSLREVQSH
jgi:sialate O-acetylesterase